MKTNTDEPPLKIKKILLTILSIVFILAFLVLFSYSELLLKTKKRVFLTNNSNLKLYTIQNNSILAISNPITPVRIRDIKMIITAYSSDINQTDNTPFITASGKSVKDGIVANNFLPFGTKIKIPKIYGNKVFIVEDRMNKRKSYYHLDIWFPSYWQAKKFGAKRTIVEILES